ncbi:MAG TPA: Uma2 family endonuclease [Tepidisphaeraceae bacterium]|nr:Uma2 family endonuclease [Tepidisphaeraceae bacterium]
MPSRNPAFPFEVVVPSADNEGVTLRVPQPLTSGRQRRIPPLETGDHLTRDEFERRYKAMPHLKKAELIEGVVYMAPAVRWDYHAEPHAKLITWLGTYQSATPGVRVGDNGSVRMDSENEPQPDAILLIEPAAGGQSRVSPDNCLEGAPELVAEVSGSTASIDLNEKFRVYLRNGVRDYLVWRVHDDEIDWFVLQGSQYIRLDAGPDGILRSMTFPGLWLDGPAMLRRDLSAVLHVLQQGLASPEHTQFAATLAGRGQAKL